MQPLGYARSKFNKSSQFSWRQLFQNPHHKKRGSTLAFTSALTFYNTVSFILQSTAAKTANVSDAFGETASVRDRKQIAIKVNNLMLVGFIV